MSKLGSQSERQFAVKTELGDDILLFGNMSLTEQLGQPFRGDIELRSADYEIDFDRVLGSKMTIEVELREGTRYFDGYVSRFVQAGSDGGMAIYHATLVPWLWFLTRTSDCEIFQEKTVPDIVKEVFARHDFAEFEESLSESYRAWPYCVQYRETDFNFVNRLLEHEGIYYYFKHEDGKHTMVLTDSPGAHESFPEYDEIKYREPHAGGTGAEAEEHIWGWSINLQVQPGSQSLNDFDYKKPSQPLDVRAIKQRDHQIAELPLYDYPGEYTETSDGDNYARVRLEELQAQHEVVKGHGDARGIATGYKFRLVDYPRTDQERAYLVTETTLNLASDDYRAFSGSGGGSTFGCSFTAIPLEEPYRPPRVTPKPIIQGPQTAIVVGPSGEEIHTNEDGCIKVEFHWDRHSDGDCEKSSCWVRVAQVWAGKKWGGVTLPRMGQEVMVEFLEGDPDRPIVTGRVYNSEQMPPYGLPANKTQSGIKSRSSKGGGDANFNEIRMEDKKGSEELYIHAEKDENIVVENDKSESVGHDESITIGNDRTESVGHDETISVGNDRTETVGNNETLTVTADRTRTVNKNETVTVALMRTHSVGVNEMINVGGAQEVTVGGLRALTVGLQQTTTIGLNHTETIGKDHSETIAKNHKAKIGTDREVDVGKDDKLKVGKKLLIEAGDEILIKTGKASIHMKKDGTVDIVGKDITVKGSGAINVKATKDIVMKGKKILQN